MPWANGKKQVTLVVSCAKNVQEEEVGKVQLIVSVLLLFLLLVAACAPKAAPAPVPRTSAPVTAPAPAGAAAVPAKPAWEEKWERVLKDAKSEGSVVIYTSKSGNAAIGQAFKTAYGISAEFVTGPSASLSEKVLREHRAGLYLVDLSTIGAITPIIIFKPAGILQPLDDMLILPDVINPEMWQGGGLNWEDPQHTTLGFVRVVMGQMVVNRDLVKPEEVKAWRDLLHPKWKNQIVIGDITLGSGAPVEWAHMIGSKIMGWDYIQEFVKQEPLIVPDARLLVEWVARGKYSIAIASRPEMVYTFVNVGAPLGVVTPAEGAWVSSAYAALNIFKNAPHPNTTKLFINWLLSKEAQTVSSQALGYPSARVDVPTAHLNPAIVPAPKVKYTLSDTEENLLTMPESAKKVKELFASLKK